MTLFDATLWIGPSWWLLPSGSSEAAYSAAIARRGPVTQTSSQKSLTAFEQFELFKDQVAIELWIAECRVSELDGVPPIERGIEAPLGAIARALRL